MSSHIISEVEQAADRAVILRAGRVVSQISRHELAARVRHCEVRFAPGQAVPDVALPGAANAAWDGDTVRFDHRGDMAPLIAALAGRPVVEFLSEPGTLLDEFFEVYREPPR